MHAGAKADIDAIESAVRSFLSAIKADDLDGVVDFYDSDAVLMPPDQAAVSGAENIREWFAAVMADFAVVDFISDPREVVVTGDWAFRRGGFTWILRPTAGGDPVERCSKFLQIWRRQDDGTWRVARGIWNADRPEDTS